MRSLAKNPDVNGRWFHSENVVCQNYGELYCKIHKDGEYYEACKRYLSIVGESGRKPLGAFMLIGLFGVLLLEAWGFSYTMSGFIDLSASENTRVIMTWIVAIAFAVILAFLTHLMGHEIYQNDILGRIRNNWKVDDPETRPKTLDAIEEDFEIENFSDENKPTYKRRLDRLDINSPKKKHTFSASAVIAIVIIGMIITYVRVKTLEIAQTQDTMCIAGDEMGGSASVNLDDLYSTTPLPPAEAQKISRDAREKGESEICRATKEGSWATFGMLAILFLVLQAFATWVSYKFGFVGKHSKTAWVSTHKYKTKAQYENAMDNAAKNIAQRAQKTLSNLQSRMARALSGETMNSSVDMLINSASSRTFLDYVEEETEQSMASRNRRTQTMQDRDREHIKIKSSPLQNSETPFSDEEIELQLLQEVKGQELSDEEVERQLIAEAQKKVETSEEQRVRILEKLKEEGKL
ncbi:hypothetical protein [Colwellia sp. 20A7]|uniref:hypothetical protein n=1 Tax=Colwellia sp. 20A7 TaxID=2689569 RepID=UPI001359F59B|nr:hypothetical protein [Colwellia sp. 20A7]